MDTPPELFGSKPRSEILIAVALLGDTFPRELSRTLGLPLITVQRILNALERQGVLASRLIGNTRLFSLNERMYGASELKTFLRKYALSTNIEQRLATLRRRPRRAGKEL
jgi:DNA-binding IclR family transcriptional regulator